MPWLTRLLADLEQDGAVLREAGPTGRYEIASYGEETYSPPVVLVSSDEDFEVLLEALGPMAHEALGGDGSSLEAAYALFWANLDEFFATDIRSGSLISIKGGRVSIRPGR